MTIIQLESFLAVVHHGSFSTAAKYCFVTQPSLSKQISNLEDELGVILLDRNSKPIVPTDVGRMVLEQAKEAIASFYSTKEIVKDIKGELTGKLRLGVIPTISPYLMPKFIPIFLKTCPKVDLEIRDMFTIDIIDALSRDLIDVAILSGGYQIKIEEVNLFDDKIFFYVSPKNELFECKKIAPEQIDIANLLILTEGNFIRNKVMKLMSRSNKYIKPQYRFANCSLETLMHTVDSTSAITIIPGMAIPYIPQEKYNQIKPFAKVHAHRKITMAVGHTYVKDSLVNAVKESIKSAAEEFAIASFLRT
ncbi:MAG: LysR family transcriptional regulator [Prevotellaceae bacterium]|jgi:LysR family hydrogen peroxide-inducible transcriptional activator|nr:LysR family transcriptional regulator [Prevotellaceae bacterium]